MDYFFVLYFIFLIRVFKTSAIKKDEYHEELFIKPLDGFIYSYFQFTTIWETPFKNDLFDHCHLFPRPMGEIIQRHNVQELHLSLTKGIWRYNAWGYPVKSAPPGAEVWAWFKPNTTNIDAKWRELTGALSGLLCASLNFIDSQNTISPRISLRPEGIEAKPSHLEPNSHERLRYSSLPREIVCTENLTPWKKLLPCNLKRGLSTLLNSDNIYNTVYHSLGVHFRPICLDKLCSRKGIELVQTVSLVYDYVIISDNDPQWSILRLFGQGLGKACPLAKTANIYIDITSNQTGTSFTLKPSNYKVLTSTRGGQTTKLAAFDTKAMGYAGLYNIEMRFSKGPLSVVRNRVPPIVSAERSLTGYGQEFGGIKTSIKNRYRAPIKIILLEAIPWYVSVYLHTLKVFSNGIDLKPIKRVFHPGRERERPHQLELVLELPPKSVTTVSIQFDYTFLKWLEYPPDAHHGFYAGGSSITAFLPVARNYTGVPIQYSLFSSSINASERGYVVRLTTETLIISLATPDFSMPYNVICLACTVVALAFGPLHNITTKRFVVSSEKEKKGLLRSPISYLIDQVKKLRTNRNASEDSTQNLSTNENDPKESSTEK
ncbi:unnamed protein product [Nezara viridula]|uniref:GPI transamidase component PIG-T n=1 Tax=Nezara viridula TaxID=85310 RepID=A0A9P0H447_NEZVI|nr:unnamed protein product [Nezara viridula]